MQKTTIQIIGMLIVLAVIVGVLYVLISDKQSSEMRQDTAVPQVTDMDNEIEATIGNPSTPTNQTNNETMTVKIASVDLDDQLHVTASFTEVEIPKTTAVLDATLEHFFNYDEGLPWLGQFRIHFDKVILQDGIARVYVTGWDAGTDTSISERVLFAEMAETALQFETVTDVEVYNNGKPAVLYYRGNGFGLCFPKITDLETLPPMHGNGEYVDATMTIHRYYKKGMTLELVYTGLRDDSVQAVAYQAPIKRSDVPLSEIVIKDYVATCSTDSLPAWSIGEWTRVGFQCRQGRGHQYFSLESCV